jgi:hypothetical protein
LAGGRLGVIQNTATEKGNAMKLDKAMYVPGLVLTSDGGEVVFAKASPAVPEPPVSIDAIEASRQTMAAIGGQLADAKKTVDDFLHRRRWEKIVQRAREGD